MTTAESTNLFTCLKKNQELSNSLQTIVPPHVNRAECCIINNRKGTLWNFTHTKVLDYLFRPHDDKVIDAPPSSGQKHATPLHASDLFWKFDHPFDRHTLLPSWIENKKEATFGWWKVLQMQELYFEIMPHYKPSSNISNVTLVYPNCCHEQLNISYLFRRSIVILWKVLF